MSKVDIRRLDSVTANDTTATALINENFEKLQAGIEDALSRTGKTPNFMDADFDMNSRRIINCGEAVEDNDVVTYKVVKDSISTAKDSATSAANSAAQAATSAQSALVSSTNAINALRSAEDTLTLASGLLTETQQYVDAAKVDIDNVVQDAKDNIDATISSAVEDVKQEATNAANAVIEQAAELAASSAKVTVDEYVLGTVTPQVQEFVSIAQQAASNADADATNAEESATIASNGAEESAHWANDAKIWATGTDGEVEIIAPGEEKHSSRVYADRAENSAIRAEEAAASATSEIEITDLGIVEGTVSLETNKVYKAMTASPYLTFDLNNVNVIMGVVNQIKVYLKVDSDVAIDWGTTVFYNGITPDIASGGKYEVYFEYNPYTFTWTAGVLSAEAV